MIIQGKIISLRKMFLFCLFNIIGVFCIAQSSATINPKSQKAPSDIQQFVGRWYPDKLGWHGPMDIYMKNNKLCLRMHTEEGELNFEDIVINESEPSIEWSYNDDVKYAQWYIGTWSETNRKEIILNVNGIYGSSGVPTEIFREGIEANHMKQCWKYFAVLDDDRLVLNYGSKSDYYSSTDELLFTKIKKNMLAINYYKK